MLVIITVGDFLVNTEFFQILFGGQLLSMPVFAFEPEFVFLEVFLGIQRGFRVSKMLLAVFYPKLMYPGSEIGKWFHPVILHTIQWGVNRDCYLKL